MDRPGGIRGESMHRTGGIGRERVVTFFFFFSSCCCCCCCCCCCFVLFRFLLFFLSEQVVLTAVCAFECQTKFVES